MVTVEMVCAVTPLGAVANLDIVELRLITVLGLVQVQLPQFNVEVATEAMAFAVTQLCVVVSGVGVETHLSTAVVELVAQLCRKCQQTRKVYHRQSHQAHHNCRRHQRSQQLLQQRGSI